MTRTLTTLLVALLLSSCTSDPDAEPIAEPQAYPVRAAPIQFGALQETISATGTVSFERTVKVRAQAAGVVHELGAKEGDTLKSGVILTRIIAPEMKARLDQIDAELRRAETERDYVCSVFETDKRLGESGALESARVDSSRKGCSSAKDGLRAIESRRSEARAALSKLVEKSPADGTLLEWSVEAGEFVGPGQPLALLGTGRRQVVLNLAETDMLRGVQVGTPVLLKGAGFETRSEVVFVAPMAKGPARTTRVEVTLPDDSTIPPGYSVDAFVILNEVEKAPLVPVAAVFQRDGEDRVVVAESGVARSIRVEPKLRASGLVAIGSEALNEGAKVVVSNPAAVPEGSALFVVEVP